jgi:chromosome segregation ATPase
MHMFSEGIQRFSSQLPSFSYVKNMMETCWSCDWKKTAMMVSVAAAVAGLVAAFFAQSILAGVGFALLGLTGSLGFWIVRDSLDEKELKAIVSQVAEDNQRIAEAEKKAEVYAKIVQSQTALLEKSREDFERQLAELSDINRQLNISKQELAKSNEQILRVNGELRSTNSTLEGKVSDLTHLLERLKIEVQSFLNQNIEFGERVGAFGSSVSSLERQDETLRSAISDLDRTFDENMEQLTAQLQLAKTTLQKLFTFICSQKEEIEKHLASLSASTAKIEALDKLLARKISELAAKEKEIEEQTARLATVQSDIVRVKSELAHENEAFASQCSALAAERLKIERERDAFALFREQLARDKREIEETTVKALAELQRHLELKQAQVEALDRKIVEKSAALRAILEEAAKHPSAATSGV